MSSSSTATGRLATARELMTLLWQRRLWWMIPMVVVLLGFSAIMVLAQGSTVAPFIYAIF